MFISPESKHQYVDGFPQPKKKLCRICDNIFFITDPAQKSKKQLFKSLCPIPSPEPTIPSVVATYDVKPSLNGDLSSKFNQI